jgi:hypothetical protein
MISSLEVMFISLDALLDIEIDRSEKTPIKAIRNVLIFGKNASFVLKYFFGVNLHTIGKNLIQMYRHTQSVIKTYYNDGNSHHNKH